MAWERLRRKCRSRIISPCSRTIPACCCPRLPGIAHYCPLKKCRKPWWPRNTAVDLAALGVSRALLRDSPAARLSQRIMNQGLSWRAAQAGANSEVFTNHESRNTNRGFFPPWVRQGGATGNRRADHCARRQVAVSRFTVVHHCSRLFAIVRYCSLLFAIVRLKILFGASLHVSPRGEAKWVRGPSGLGASRAEEKGARRLARAGVLEQYVEHGKQAQRSPGGRIRVLRPSGGETCGLVSPRRPVAASLGAMARLRAAIARHARGGVGVSQCLCPVSRSRSALRRAPPPGRSRCREHKTNPC